MASIYDKSSLVLIPSGTKTGKVYSQKPVSGDGDFNFTRSSAATRVNADGFIEKERGNQLLYSNQPNLWTFVSVSLTGGQTGYDGSSDAWLLASTGASGSLRQNLSYSSVVSYSFYAKAGSVDYVRLRLDAATQVNAWFLLSGSGSVGTLTNGISSSIESVGGGWYRVSVIANATSLTTIRVYPAPTDGGGNSSGDSIYIQDAQVEQGLVARDYIETTTTAVEGGITDNVPRLDYTDSSCPALLLEPLRTNLVTQSEYFGGFTSTNVVLTPNAAIGPEGVQNAYQIDDNATNGEHKVEQIITSTTGVHSAFVKSNGGDFVQFVGVGTAWYQNFDITNGVLGTGDALSADIEDYGNGWYRIWAYDGNPNTKYQLNIVDSASAARARQYTGDGSNSIYIYGAQVEAGSYATSYIPTYGSSVTRVGDNMDTTFSSPIPTTGNVSYFIHLDGSDRSGNATAPHATIRFAGNDYISYNVSGGGYHRFRVNVDGTANYYTGNLLKSQEAKLLAVINGDYIKIFMNGQQVNQGTLLGTPNMISATGYTGSTNESLGPLPIKELLLISTALTDQEAIDLTTI